MGVVIIINRRQSQRFRRGVGLVEFVRKFDVDPVDIL